MNRLLTTNEELALNDLLRLLPSFDPRVNAALHRAFELGYDAPRDRADDLYEDKRDCDHQGCYERCNCSCHKDCAICP